MFVAIYRWLLKPGLEADFQRAWSRITSLYVERWGSAGSALFKRDDGVWVGIARWPSREARARAFEAAPVDPEASALMRSAIATTLPGEELDCVEDQWVPPAPGQG
jgi:hypothetical protein